MGYSPELHSTADQPSPMQNASRPIDVFGYGTEASIDVSKELSAGTILGRVRLPQGTTSVELDSVKRIIHERGQRARWFASQMFADPAWDILLGLARAEMEHRRMTISNLCLEAAVPQSTALRWIDSMTRDGTLERRPDDHDRRRAFIELSCASSQSMKMYLSDLQI